MVDITMCTNCLCPKASSCYRVKAIPGQWQSWASFDYTVSVNGIDCDHYIPVCSTAVVGREASIRYE